MNNHEHDYWRNIRGELRCVWCMEPKPIWEQKADGDDTNSK